MPEEAKERRRRAADGRHFVVDHHGLSFTGTSTVYGELDLADALDLDQAVGAEAQRRADLGCTEPLDIRRPWQSAPSPAATSPSTTPPPTPPPRPTPSPSGTNSPRRHRPDQPARRRCATQCCTCTCPKQRSTVARAGRSGAWRTTRSPVTAETIRDWLGRPDLKVVVQPVIDLAEHVSVEAYEVPDRVAEPAVLRDVSCVFPWCTRPARRLHPDEHPCDREHVIPHSRGGPTCSCQIAPLCRRHHRLKTHGGWSYYVLEPGSYVWTSPHRYQYLRDHTGTLDISHDKHQCRPHHPPPAET